MLSEKDMPFSGEFYLNPETRFVKIVPVSISGTVRLNGFRVSDAKGYFGEGYDGIIDVEAGDEAEAPAYNLLGLPVDATYKGVVIKAGKKYIQR